MKKVNFIDNNGNTETVVFTKNARTNRLTVIAEYVDAEDLCDALHWYFEGEGWYTQKEAAERNKERTVVIQNKEEIL